MARFRGRASRAELATQPWPVDEALFPGWDGTVAGAFALQAELAATLKIKDDFAVPLRRFAGVDVGFEDDGRTTRAAAVLLDGQTLRPLAEVIVRCATTMPYVPGLLSFRELPAVVAAVRQLPAAPDLVVCDGQGIAHPRRLGIAAHFGIATGLPSIGVAKTRLTGTHEPVGLQRGDRSVLCDRQSGEPMGWVLRSRNGVHPLFVSPGHRVGLDTAAELILRLSTGRHRLPEPTRLADRLASRRAATPPQPWRHLPRSRGE